MVVDSISNFIIQIKNASRAGHDKVCVPYSILKEKIAEVLMKGGYVKSVTKKGKKIGKILELELPKTGSKRPKDIKRISKSSRRIYRGVDDLKKYQKMKGLTVVSTPKGVLSVGDAVAQKVGGEVIFNIR